MSDKRLKNSQILRAHMTYFCRPSHICKLFLLAWSSLVTLLLLLDGQGYSGKTICQARPQAFKNVHILIGTKNHQDVT